MPALHTEGNHIKAAPALYRRREHLAERRGDRSNYQGNIAYVGLGLPDGRTGTSDRRSVGWRGSSPTSGAPVIFDKNWNLPSREYQSAFIRDWPTGAPAVSACSCQLARGATVTASSTYDACSDAAKAVDGSCIDTSRWMSAVGDTTPVLMVDLGTYNDVSQVDIFSRYGCPNLAAGTVLTTFQVEVHIAAGWVQLGTVTANTRPCHSQHPVSRLIPAHPRPRTNST